MKKKISSFFLKKSTIICGSIIILLVLISLISPLFETVNYQHTDIAIKNMSPNNLHWFGTDLLGRDMWSRVWFGLKISLLISVICTLISQIFGLIIGSIAGYYGGMLDTIIMSIVDIGVCIPSLIYVTIIMIYFGNGIPQMILAITLSSWMQTARIARSRILQYKNQEFILYTKIQGASSLKIIFKQIFPNISGQFITDLITTIPMIIFTESYLSFIGLGVSSPMVSLGQLCKTGLNMYRLYPYQFFIPAIVLITLVLCFYIIGNNLRDHLDHKVVS